MKLTAANVIEAYSTKVSFNTIFKLFPEPQVITYLGGNRVGAEQVGLLVSAFPSAFRSTLLLILAKKVLFKISVEKNGFHCSATQNKTKKYTHIFSLRTNSVLEHMLEPTCTNTLERYKNGPKKPENFKEEWILDNF